MNKAEARICSSSSKIIMMTWALDFQILLNAQQIFWKTLCGLLKWNRSKRCDFCACQVDTPPPHTHPHLYNLVIKSLKMSKRKHLNRTLVHNIHFKFSPENIGHPYMASTHMAIPIPPPMHKQATPFFLLSRFREWSRVVKTLAPVTRYKKLLLIGQGL